MFLPIDECEHIRREYHVYHKSIRQIARETGHCRDAIRNALSDGPSPPPPPSPFQSRSSPIFGPFQGRVEALLAQNDCLPRKQRYTSHRIFEIIHMEGYQGCESRVRQHIAEWKRIHHPPEVFLPLEFEPGQDAQVDWGEATVVLAGQRQSIQVFVMRLCYSL